MDFGLWVEPEMVSPDSELFRAHPDWILSEPGRLPPTWRSQHVVDLANPFAFDFLLERLDTLLSDHDIAYLKWDHNRDLVDAGHEGRAGVRLQTLALYRLLDELRARHPHVEIESCASGGGRVDLGILERTDRVWPSDTMDALERQHIQGLDPASHPARAGWHAHRLHGLAHDRASPLAVLPSGDGALRPLGHRVGPDRHHLAGG